MNSSLDPARANTPVRALALLPFGLHRFLSVGVVGLAADVSSLWLLEQFGLAPAPARVASLSIATVVTWTLNRRLTFGASGRRRLHELARYSAVALAAQGLNFVVFLEIVHLAPALPHTFAAICGAMCAAFFSYLGQRFFTFRRIQTGDVAP